MSLDGLSTCNDKHVYIDRKYYKIEVFYRHKVLIVFWTFVWKGPGMDEFSSICSRSSPDSQQCSFIKDNRSSLRLNLVLLISCKSNKRLFWQTLGKCCHVKTLEHTLKTQREKMTPQLNPERSCCLWWKCIKTRNRHSFLWQHLIKFWIIVMGETERFVCICSDLLMFSSLKNFNNNWTYYSICDLHE